MFIIRYTLKDGTKQKHLFETEHSLMEFHKTSQQFPHRTNYEAYEVDLDSVIIKKVKL